MNISHQIKLCRENKGYSQEYLAEKLYVSRQTISNWENERSYPDVHNLIMMCELFNVSLDDLVQGEIHMDVYNVNTSDRFTYIIRTLNCFFKLVGLCYIFIIVFGRDICRWKC